jgi:hypothetical protein
MISWYINKEINDDLRMQLAFSPLEGTCAPYVMTGGYFHEKARSSNGRSGCSFEHRGLRAGRQGQGPAAGGN